jgi:arylsulfatase A-like enzyme
MRGTTINGSRNTPLRGSKRTTLEGGVHVPFVVSWHGRIPAGKTYERPIIQLDIQPTALAAAGVTVQPDWKLDGVNLLPYLMGENNEYPHETLYWRLGEQMAVRHGDWKLVRYDQAADDGPAGQVTPPKLYNLANDIGESHDLLGAEPAKARELTTVWETWNQQLAEPLWGQVGRRRGR